jgi:hypothetical protein
LVTNAILNCDPICIKFSALPDAKKQFNVEMNADIQDFKKGSTRKHSTRSFAASLSEPMPLPRINPASSTFKKRI